MDLKIITFKMMAIIVLLLAVSCTNKQVANKDQNNLNLARSVLVKASEQSEDSLDFIIVADNGTADSLHPFHKLTKPEMTKAREILSEYISKGKFGREYAPRAIIKTKNGAEMFKVTRKPLPFRNYFRQYYGFEENGDIKTRVNLFAFYRAERGLEELDTLEYMTNDGGRNIANSIVNITKGFVESFYVHGDA